VGKFTAKSRRQLGSTMDGLPYAAMLHGHAGPQEPKRQYKPPGKYYDQTEPAANRRTSLRDLSGPLCGMPDGTTLSAQGAIKSVVPAGE
jgi:hypothetical protein